MRLERKLQATLAKGSESLTLGVVRTKPMIRLMGIDTLGVPIHSDHTCAAITEMIAAKAPKGNDATGIRLHFRIL